MKSLRNLLVLASLTIANITFANVYLVTNTAGNDWWPACGAAGSLKEALCNARTNPGRDTIEFDLPGGTTISAAMNPLPIDATDNDLYINGNGNNGSPVRFSFSVTVSGSNIDLDSLSFQTTNHSLNISGSNNSIKHSSFVTSGAGQNSVWVTGGTNNLVRKNTFTASLLHAVSIENTGSHRVDSNTVTGITDVGIIARGTGNNVIAYNSVSAGSHNGIGTLCANNTIEYNATFNNARAGIVVDNSLSSGSGNIIRNNVVYGNNTNFWMNFGAPTPDQGGISSNGPSTTISNNIVYSNAANGIIVNSATGTNAIIQNNVVGRDALNNAAGNGWNGIFVWQANGANISGNIVVNNGAGSSHGTYSMPDRISGIRMQEVTSGTIDANYVGTDASSAVGEGNDFDGITLHTNVSGITVSNNYITDNGLSSTYGAGGGIALRNTANNNIIQSNFIGERPDGSDGGNNDYGIAIEVGSGNTIGGANGSNGNVIANSKNTGNQGCGIWLVLNGNTDNEVYHNTIKNNNGDGILIERGASGNIVGAANQGNTISGNNNGIHVKRGTGGNTTNNNTLRYNSFSCNRGRGIELADQGNNEYGVAGTPKGVTVNSSESRPNMVSGTAPALSLVDIYVPDVAPCQRTCTSDSAMGLTYSATVTADASGFWEYDYTLDANGVAGGNVIIMATVDAAAGSANSSEFSVCRIACVPAQNLTINTNDSTLCPGESTVLEANANGLDPNSDYHYTWYRNSIETDSIVGSTVINDSTITLSTAGAYYVIVTFKGDTNCADTAGPVNIVVNPNPTLNLTPANASFCAGSNVNLVADTTGTNAAVTFSWSTGATSDQINVAAAGSYSVTVTNPATGCDTSGNVTVTENPLPVIPAADGKICRGDSTLLDAGNAGATFLWTPTNETTQTVYAKVEGNYTITVTLPTTCVGSKTVFIDESPAAKPTVTARAANGTLCYLRGDQDTLTATVNAVLPGTLSWSTGQTTDTLIYVQDTMAYTVTFTDSFGCQGSDTVEVANLCLPPDPETPNLITPDNPEWVPFGEIDPADIIKSHFIVYNRWGRKMYETEEILPRWNGTNTTDGQCSSGVYFWIWTYEDVTQTEHKLNGFLELISTK